MHSEPMLKDDEAKITQHHTYHEESSALPNLHAPLNLFSDSREITNESPLSSELWLMWPQMMLMMSSLVSSSLSFETSEVRDAEMTVLLICDDSSATCCPLFVASCLCPIVLDHVFLLLGGFESTASNCATTCPTPSQHLHVRRWQHLLVR